MDITPQQDSLLGVIICPANCERLAGQRLRVNSFTATPILFKTWLVQLSISLSGSWLDAQLDCRLKSRKLSPGLMQDG
jgi:hypothetical protein